MCERSLVVSQVTHFPPFGGYIMLYNNSLPPTCHFTFKSILFPHLSLLFIFSTLTVSQFYIVLTFRVSYCPLLSFLLISLTSPSCIHPLLIIILTLVRVVYLMVPEYSNESNEHLSLSFILVLSCRINVL